MSDLQLPLLAGFEPRSVNTPAESYVQRAREVAARICQAQGFATADDVRDALGPPPSNGHAGAVFAAELFYELGRVPTRAPEGHYRKIGKYGLRARGRRELLGEP